MFKIFLICDGVPEGEGPEAASEITKEFAVHRKWYSNVLCTWTGQQLRLEAESDVDTNGLALLDEFSDCISAYVSSPFDGEVKVASTTET